MAIEERHWHGRAREAEQLALQREWRRLSRAATIVAILTSPVTFAFFYVQHDWPLGWALLATFVFVIAFRGFMDVLSHRLIPRASLYGATVTDLGNFILSALPFILIYGIQIPLLFFANLLILFGPLLFFGLKQMKGYEPGDADWGVKLDDVRGQAESKDEVQKVIELWSAGDEFRAAGGKPERGMVFIDEIDAVGMRRQALQGARFEPLGTQIERPLYGPWGSLTPTGDLIKEDRRWREHVFAMRAEQRPDAMPAGLAVVRDRINTYMFPGGMMGGQGQLALNQLLVQMDGVEEPPFVRKHISNRVNTFLDATYFIPRKIGKLRLRLKPPKPRPEQVYFIGATNVPIDALDPALVRPGRMGRHIWFRTPTKDDRKDIFDLYLNKVAHDPELDRPERRDELARMTNGYSPAMIEQVCSMALTYAHSDGRPEFDRADIVGAMTTIESGTAVGVTYVPEESRATAIHEAGHAVTSHVYMRNTVSTRLSIRMRGRSQGHHRTIATEERFSEFRHEMVGDLVWGLGAMAAEHVFYGENTNGVGGDLQSATYQAAYMVGASGMGPEPLDLRGRVPKELLEETEKKLMERFERIGLQIMNRASSGSAMQGDPIAVALGDPAKRRAAAQILGQAYMTALCCIRHNRQAGARLPRLLLQEKELYGDEVVELLDESNLEAPIIDVLDESIWPKL